MKTETKARFELREITILDPDGVDRTYKIVVDRNSFKKLGSDFGASTFGQGYLRCKGRHYVGTFGHNSPVFGGRNDDTYFSTVTYCDGEWQHSGCDESRPGHNTITKDSGTGKLFSALSNFCEANNVPYDGE